MRAAIGIGCCRPSVEARRCCQCSVALTNSSMIAFSDGAPVSSTFAERQVRFQPRLYFVQRDVQPRVAQGLLLTGVEGQDEREEGGKARQEHGQPRGGEFEGSCAARDRARPRRHAGLLRCGVAVHGKSFLLRTAVLMREL